MQPHKLCTSIKTHLTIQPTRKKREMQEQSYIVFSRGDLGTYYEAKTNKTNQKI